MAGNTDRNDTQRLKTQATAEGKTQRQLAKPLPAEVKAELVRCRKLSPPVEPGAPLAEDVVREMRDTG